MKKYRYTTTDCFKPGESVWVTGFKTTPGGRIKYIIRPSLNIISSVDSSCIGIDRNNSSCYLPWSAPSIYYLDTPERSSSREYSLNLNIAKTKEDAIENYNQAIIEEIEERFKNFQDFEKKLKTYLL